MAVSGSISQTGSTSSSISVSWSISGGGGGFTEIYVTGAGQSLYSEVNVSSPQSGSATVTGLSPSTSYTFSWAAQDLNNDVGSGSYSFSTAAEEPPPSWTDNSIFGTAFKGGYYSDGVSATNSPTYSVYSGSLPPGISLNSSTGAITGYATSLGNYSFTIRATNGSGYVSVSASINVVLAFSIAITGVGSITSDSFTFTYLADNSDNASGASISFSSSPYALIEAPSDSTLLAGQIFNETLSVSGLEQGTSYTITATMTSGSDTATDTETVTTLYATPVFTDSSVNSFAVVGYAYSDGVSASYATNYTVHSGSLPTGLSLNTSTGAITGTPTTAGTYNFVVRAYNPSYSAYTPTLTITVEDLLSEITVSVGNATNFTDDDPYAEYQEFDFQVYADNQSSYSSTLTLSISPSGVIQSPTTYTVASGSSFGPATKHVTALDPGREYSVTGTLTLAGNIASETSTLVVKTPMIWIWTTPNDGFLNCLYESVTFSIASYNAVTFSIYSGSLPPGLSLNGTTGVLSGTPTSLGTYPITIRATNAIGQVLDIERVIVISNVANPGVVLGVRSQGQSTEYSPGEWSTTFVLEIDATESIYSESGGVIEVAGHPEITFSEDSFEITGGTIEQKIITVYGLTNNESFIVTASITIACFELTNSLELVVGILPDGIVYVKVDGTWKAATVYAKNDGVWKQGNIWIKKDGIWKVSKS